MVENRETDSIDNTYMWRAIQLAAGVNYSVAPNPMVGAVIVHRGCIIGEGFHARYGQGHAEVNALASVRKPELLKDSTMYVTLEPCSHYGKTPPCSRMIIEKQIPRVVVGCLDPFPEVAGRGISMLREAGVDVKTGVLEKECLELNKRFITFHTRKRPYVILKWAQTADGFLDKLRTSNIIPPVTISTPFHQLRVHKLRSEVSAILVGTRTALLDNPSLNVRYWSGKPPLRIVLDRDGEIPISYKLKDGAVPTWIITERDGEEKKNMSFVSLDFDDRMLPELLWKLYDEKKQSLLVEGGAALLSSFITAGCWDEAIVETGNISIGSGVKAPILEQAELSDVPLIEDGHLLQTYRHVSE